MKKRHAFMRILLLCILLSVFVQGVMAGECYALNRQWDIGDPSGYKLAAAPGIAMDGSGNTYVSTLTRDQQEIMGGGIKKISPEGIISPWGPSYGLSGGPSETEILRVPLGIAVDSPENEVYVTEMEADTQTGTSEYYVHKFTSAGGEITRWGPFGAGTFSGFDNPLSLLGVQGAIALDSTGNVYVNSISGSSPSAGQVIVFDGNGGPVSLWDIVDSDGVGYLPMGITIDSADTVYISAVQMSETTLVSHVLTFNRNGNPVFHWEVGGLPEGLNFVTGIAADSEGDVYVNQIQISLAQETASPRVVKYDSEGKIINQWSIGEQAVPAIHLPMGIFVNDAGEVYLTESAMSSGSLFTTHVQKYISEYCEYIANLYVSKSAPVSVEGGQALIYSISYINLGLGTATNVVLEDSFLDPALTFVSASSPGQYNAASRSVTWELGSLEMGEYGSQTLTLMTGTDEERGTIITNRATISTTDPELSLEDNEAISTTRITQSNLPPGVELEPNNGGVSEPSVYWETPVTLIYRPEVPSDPNCEITGVSYHIVINDDFSGTDSVIDGVFHEDANDPGLWKSDPITFYPAHGKATTTYTVYTSCNPQPASIEFSFYIDPAGYIYDVATGARIEGASVWLQRPDGSGGWGNIPPGQSVMQPDDNPIITKANGQYQWDVLPGLYRVHVEAPGYLPADSIVVSIPPPVMDLHVGLTKEGSTPVPEFPSTILPATMIVGVLGAVLLIQRTREH